MNPASVEAFTNQNDTDVALAASSIVPADDCSRETETNVTLAASAVDPVEKDCSHETETHTAKKQKTLHLNIPRDLDPCNPAHFDHFLFHLLSYRAQTQSFVVTNRESPELHKFTMFLKHEYRKHQITAPQEFATNATSLLSAAQFEVLQDIGVPLVTRKARAVDDERWQRYYVMLQEFQLEHGHTLVPQSTPKLGEWVKEQRQQYRASWLPPKGSAKARTGLSRERQEKLEKLGFVWKVRNRPGWVSRHTGVYIYSAIFRGASAIHPLYSCSHMTYIFPG